MSRIILNTIFLMVFTLVGKSQTPYTLTDTDVTLVNGVIISSTLTDANGDNYQPDIIITKMLDGQVITGIGENAFRDNSLTSVVLPTGLTSIGDGAFQNNNLTSVNLPAGLLSIGDNAFENNRLTSVDLPSGLTSVKRSTFATNNIISLTLNGTLKTEEEYYLRLKRFLKSGIGVISYSMTMEMTLKTGMKMKSMNLKNEKHPILYLIS